MSTEILSDEEYQVLLSEEKKEQVMNALETFIIMIVVALAALGALGALNVGPTLETWRTGFCEVAPDACNIVTQYVEGAALG